MSMEDPFSVWAGFANEAKGGGKEVVTKLKPFIEAASAMGLGGLGVSGVTGAFGGGVYDSVLRARAADEGLASSAGSKSKYYSHESAANKGAELRLARALTLIAATVLCDGAPAELQFPSRMRKSRSVILNGATRADDSHHNYLTGRLPYGSIEDFENLLHAVSFRRDWNGELHHVYSAQIAKFAREWNMELHRDFMSYLVLAIGVKHVEESMGQLVHALRMVGFIHQSREGDTLKAVSMRDGAFDGSIGIQAVEKLVGIEARRRRELREAQERAIAEQIREVEELARQQVELDMNPMLSSW